MRYIKMFFTIPYFDNDYDKIKYYEYSGKITDEQIEKDFIDKLDDYAEQYENLVEWTLDTYYDDSYDESYWKEITKKEYEKEVNQNDKI